MTTYHRKALGVSRHCAPGWSVGPAHLLFAASLLAASAWLLGAVGPMLAAGLASIVLTFVTLGFRVMPLPLHSLGRDRWSRCGPFVVTHCHHEPAEFEQHEIFLFGKHFCAGCLGLAAGTAAGVVLAAARLTGSLTLSEAVIGILILGSFMIIGIIASGRYRLHARSFLYACMPVGCWLCLAELHLALGNPWLNIAALVAVAAVWFLACIYFVDLRAPR